MDTGKSRFPHLLLTYIVLIGIIWYLSLPDLRRPSSYQLPETSAIQVKVSIDEKQNMDVYEKCAPGVVNITTMVVSRDFFFQIYPRQGSGSGFVFDSRGYVLTNYHVIEGATAMEMTTSDGTRHEALLVGADPESDIAVLRFANPPANLPVIPLGDSRAMVIGQRVLAIGNPFGLSGTLTTGIVSSLGRTIRTGNDHIMEGLIQTDAAINPGNSGGPLLNSSGEAIGVNTMIYSPSGGNVGIGFAVPINRARNLIPDLVTTGKWSRPWLGISGQTLFPSLSAVLGLPVGRGVMVVEAEAGSPAGKAGIRGCDGMVRYGHLSLPSGGDIIVAVNGNKISDNEDLAAVIGAKRPGDRVSLTAVRGGKAIEIEVVLEKTPAMNDGNNGRQR